MLTGRALPISFECLGSERLQQTPDRFKVLKTFGTLKLWGAGKVWHMNRDVTMHAVLLCTNVKMCFCPRNDDSSQFLYTSQRDSNCVNFQIWLLLLNGCMCIFAIVFLWVMTKFNGIATLLPFSPCFSCIVCSLHDAFWPTWYCKVDKVCPLLISDILNALSNLS